MRLEVDVDAYRNPPSDEVASAAEEIDVVEDLSEPVGEVTPVAERADQGWVDRVSTVTGVPSRAMHAYAGAALWLAEENPSCGIGWNTLAAIGEVESHHGGIDGNVLLPDGHPRVRIIGVALSGEGVARIRDTDGGVLDDDPEWDRAVGPMQFIPATWSQWAADGNGDGVRDPQQIDDAVLAAARYLCFAGGDLSVPGNWISAVTAYNHSIEYNNRVAEVADRYRLLAEGQ
ncbi:lytic transglycosylase domain-containing protein [Populibacterium corticicola]|uniref:Lytic transglycosylase domain-containing protein n=1 Tax=Populibacterium corticicola TaxID=1812826 RepID=A0ABW5XEB5_9MICO